MDSSDVLKEFIRKNIREIYKEDLLKEMTVTSDIEGYDTPFAFTGGKGKKKKLRISTNSTGYKLVNEEIDGKDIKLIQLIIRDEVADILIYLLAFCNSNNIDISEALMKKMKKNNEKYPADKFKGHF